MEREPGRKEWELNIVLVIEKEKEMAHLKIGSRVSLGPVKSR